MCGEKAYPLTVCKLNQGSPPRVRGKAIGRCFGARSTRITPACAGKSDDDRRKRNVIWDHPRVCGEKGLHPTQKPTALGSPPRVRGKALIHFPCRSIFWDHPRVCGEKYLRMRGNVKEWGSPPRVRGKAYKAAVGVVGRGITPACAGKRLKKAHKIKDFDPVPIRFHLVFRRFERWCSNLPMPDGNVPV